MNITLQWDDPDRVLAETMRMLEARGAAIRQVPERAVRRGTFELLRLVQQEVPKVTTTLVKSLTATVQKIGDDIVEGRVGTWLEYARYVEEGTGIYGPKKQPITVSARRKKALFRGAYNDKGKPIMAKRVQIKGMKPRAPFAKAITKFLPRYVEIIQQELARANS